MIIIPKRGKPLTSPESYIPIRLLPTISKLLEKVIFKRLKGFVTNEKILPNFQYGFREELSTINQIHRLTENIYKGFEKKQYTVADFLDVKQAFDSVWHKGLVQKTYHSWSPLVIPRKRFPPFYPTGHSWEQYIKLIP